MKQSYTILKKYWGYDTFREPQEEVIKSILQHKDCLILIPTGGGKSLTFQVPALLSEGLTIVISPLIALMEDQVNNLTEKGIKATFLNSSLLPSEYKARSKALLNNQYKLLYVSPEQLASKKLKGILAKLELSRIVLDEAHCLSEWGHDFRPDYKRILSNITELKDNFQIVALTATATERVKTELLTILKLKEPFISISSFDRKNIFIGTKFFFTQLGKYLTLKKLLKNSSKSLIYCSTRNETELMAKKMENKLKIPTGFYHAGLKANERKEIQEDFKTGKLKYLFATTAFGMGIDISDIDMVIYWNCPSSLEEYYQGIGRAGRNSKIEAKSWVLYSSKDTELQKNLIEQELPTLTEIKKVIELIKDEQSFFKIKSILKLNEAILNAIILLEEEGREAKEIFNALKDLSNSKMSRFKKLKKYLSCKSCKRKEVLDYFEEVQESNFCNNCSNCC